MQLSIIACLRFWKLKSKYKAVEIEEIAAFGLIENKETFVLDSRSLWKKTCSLAPEPIIKIFIL